MTLAEPYIIRRPLTGELADPDSPVRQFMDTRFTRGLREVQRRYREAAPPIAVLPAPQAEANPGTVGTAADWLLRFLTCACPPLDLAAHGAILCGARPSSPNLGMIDALSDLAGTLGMSRADLRHGRHAFTGPARPSDAEPEYLARACWALALLTEVYRGGLMVAEAGPLARFRDPRPVPEDRARRPQPDAADLLALAPPAAVEQLAAFRQVFQSALLPALAGRRGMWAIGPTFTGSQLMNADADLIAAGLLLDLKTSAKKPSLCVADLFQVIGYALLDFDDEFAISSVGIFSARYAYLATWELGALLDELAGHETSLAVVRGQFRELLAKHAPPARQDRPGRPARACEYPLAISARLVARVGGRFSRPGDNMIPEQVFCEIQHGHPGPHLAQIQAFGDDEAWAEWATGDAPAVRYFSEDTLCDARGRDIDDGQDDELCTLPAGHYGDHAFSMQHVHSEGRDLSPAIAARLAQEDRTP